MPRSLACPRAGSAVSDVASSYLYYQNLPIVITDDVL